MSEYSLKFRDLSLIDPNPVPDIMDPGEGSSEDPYDIDD